jgi:glucan phosphoethanolaminetransferase (alkaline phosphatase superfamily)
MRSPIPVRIPLLAAACALPYALMLVFAVQHHYGLRSVLALVASATLLCCLLAAGLRRWRPFFLAYLPLLVLSVAYCAYAFSFNMVPGRIFAIVMLSASAEELRGLLTVWPQKWLLLPACGLLVASVWAAWGLGEQLIYSGKHTARVLLGVALLATAAAASDPGQLINGFTANPALGSLMFLAGELPHARAEIHGASVRKIPFHATRSSAAEEVHVLIVGESARRSSWSLYGYNRETTPYLESIRREIIPLQHVVADANLTMLAVPMLLTGTAPQDYFMHPMHGSLFDLVKEAGYSTTWLVNQDFNVTTAIGITADHLDVPPELHEGIFGRHVLDDLLLPPLHQALARSGPRFIGMHIMESHWEYYLRYPPNFRRYDHHQWLNPVAIMWGKRKLVGEELVDTYDNSTLHADWFLGQVIEAVRQLRTPATVTFIPDHGESLEDLGDGMAGHGGPVYGDSQFQVPAFVWVNDAYRAAHPDKVAALSANAAQEIHSHDFFYAVADLMGVTWPGFSPQRSFVSPQYVPDTARQVLLGGNLQTRPANSAAAGVPRS